MRILVNDIAASGGGALSVLRDFYSYIKASKTDDEWIFLLSDNYIEETENIKVILLPEVKKSHTRKLKFDFFDGKKVINRLNPDVVISMQNIITFGVKAPQLVYIHQAIPFQDSKRFSFRKASERAFAIYQHLVGGIIKLSAKKADMVVVQTEWMKKAVVKKAGTKADKVIICPPKIEIESLSNLALCSKSFFYPTSNSIYKNNECIYKAAEILHQDGIGDFSVTLTLDKEKKMNHCEFVGRLKRQDVMEKYANSVLLFPSYIESAAFPLIEAKKVGTIILASDTPLTHDVLGSYENAYYFDPFEPQQLADLMKKVINGEIKRKEIETKAEKDDINGWSVMLSVLREMV